MKKLRNLLVIVMAFAAISFTFTACSKSANNDAEEVVEEAMDEATDGATEGEASEAEATTEGEATEGGATEGGATEGGAATAGGSYSWSSDLDNWVTSGTGSKTITLEGITGEGELSAEGRGQLDLIISMLETHEELNATIKGHTTADQKIGNGKPRAVWTKAKLILGHDAAGSRISTEGAGSKEPIEGVDANDPSQKRITVTFSK